MGEEDLLTSNGKQVSLKKGANESFLLRYDLKEYSGTHGPKPEAIYLGHEEECEKENDAFLSDSPKTFINYHSSINSQAEQKPANNYAPNPAIDSFLNNEPMPNTLSNYSSENQAINDRKASSNLPHSITIPSSIDNKIEETDIDKDLIDEDNEIDSEELTTMSSINSEYEFEVRSKIPTKAMKEENYNGNSRDEPDIIMPVQKKIIAPEIISRSPRSETRFPHSESLIPSCKKELSPADLAGYIFSRANIYIESSLLSMVLKNPVVKKISTRLDYNNSNIDQASSQQVFEAFYVKMDAIASENNKTVGGYSSGTLEGIIKPKLISNSAVFPQTRRALPGTSEFNFIVRKGPFTFEGDYREIGENEQNNVRYMMCRFGPGRANQVSIDGCFNANVQEQGLCIFYASDSPLNLHRISE